MESIRAVQQRTSSIIVVLGNAAYVSGARGFQHDFTTDAARMHGRLDCINIQDAPAMHDDIAALPAAATLVASAVAPTVLGTVGNAQVHNPVDVFTGFTAAVAATATAAGVATVFPAALVATLAGPVIVAADPTPNTSVLHLLLS